MANVRRILFGNEHFTSSTCGFGFVDSVHVPTEPIDEMHVRVRRVLSLFPGTKLELGPLVKDDEVKKAEPEKGREDPPAAIAHVRLDDLGNGIWAAIPVDVDGKDRECLVADGGGVMMSHDDAMALAVEHATSLGVEVKEPAKTDEAPAGDPDEKPEPIPLEVTGKAHPDEEPKADAPAEPVADAGAPDAVEPVVEAEGKLDNGADVAALAKAAADDEAAKVADEPKEDASKAETVVVKPPKKGNGKKKGGKKS